MTNHANRAGEIEDKLVQVVDQACRDDLKDRHGQSASGLSACEEAKTFLREELGVDVQKRARELNVPVQEAMQRAEAEAADEEFEERAARGHA
jgi:hypothetical protein